MTRTAFVVAMTLMAFRSAGEPVNPAEEVLDAFANALGGEAAWEALGDHRLRGIYTGSHLRFYGVDELPFEALYDGAGCWKRTWPSSGITETIIPERGWRFYPEGAAPGTREMTAFEHAYLSAELPGAMVEWRRSWRSAEHRGESRVGGEATVIIELRHRSADLTVRRHFSVESGLLLLSTGTGPAGEMATTYEDYRDVSGVRLPFLRTVDAGPDAHHVYAITSLDPDIEIDARACAPG